MQIINIVIVIFIFIRIESREGEIILHVALKSYRRCVERAWRGMGQRAIICGTEHRCGQGGGGFVTDVDVRRTWGGSI